MSPWRLELRLVAGRRLVVLAAIDDAGECQRPVDRDPVWLTPVFAFLGLAWRHAVGMPGMAVCTNYLRDGLFDVDHLASRRDWFVMGGDRRPRTAADRGADDDIGARGKRGCAGKQRKG